jgi:hypothetical protein
MECVRIAMLVAVAIVALRIRRIRIARRYSKNRTMRALSVASMLKRVQRDL